MEKTLHEIIQEQWNKWEEVSEEEYVCNKDNPNYTYIVDQDTNKICKFMKLKS